MFVFISTMSLVPWGGSENLWHGAAKHLLARGAAVQTQTAQWPCVPRPLEQLATDGAVVTFRASRPPFAWRILRRLSSSAAFRRKWENRTRGWISSMPSPKVIVSCGSLVDDFSQLVCMSEGRTPYVIIVQAAGPEIWPVDAQLGVVCKLLINARRVFFVSHHNLEDVQQCLGMELPNAEVIWNPVNRGSTLRAMNVTFPRVHEGSLRLACVARLDVAKGQDVLLKTLALKKWKDRDVALTLFGEGPHRQVLHNLARYLNLERVSFAGQVDDILSVWDRHNLGVFVSRYEGLALAVMEAMMLGRPNVVTRGCGNSEVVEDNQTGFIANASTVEAFDEALERAWQRRTELPSMGALAARRIRELTPEDPCLEFAERLLVVFS
jgi:glycosyltransferase involved in cell wall biosynthesis